jgi:hypothetical protein
MGPQAKRIAREAAAYEGPGSSVVREIIDPHTRHELIAQAAYFLAERRGFQPGHEAQDWHAAEAEIDSALSLGVVK